MRPAVVEGVAFDSLVRHVGPACDALVAAIAQPPDGAETLVRRAVETLADMSEYSEVEAQALAAAALEAGEEAKPPPPKQAPAALIAAVEKLAANPSMPQIFHFKGKELGKHWYIVNFRKVWERYLTVSAVLPDEMATKSAGALYCSDSSDSSSD